MKAQTDVLDEFVPSINVEASIVAGHLRPFEGAQRRICLLSCSTKANVQSLNSNM